LTPANVADSYNQLRQSAINLHSYLTDLDAQLTAGSTGATFLMVVLGAAQSTLELAQSITTAAPIGSQLGNALDAYVQQQTGWPTLDVHTELSTSMSALGNFVAALVGEYPKDVNGHLLDRIFDANGNLVWAQIPASTLLNTKAAITAWLATVS
jgi:hypothetical protein